MTKIIINVDWLRFLQDRAPPHYVAAVSEYLNNRLSEQWIPRRGPITWLASSSVLSSPINFFGVTYRRGITPDMLQNVFALDFDNILWNQIVDIFKTC